MVRAITQRAPTPAARRRRHKEETSRAFKMTASDIMRRAARLPVIAHATEFLAETLDWLHFWNWNNPDPENEASESFHYADHDHLSPHL